MTVPVVVHETGISSIVAYALDTLDYKHALQDELKVVKNVDINVSPQVKRRMLDTKENQADTPQTGELKRPSVLSFLRPNSSNLSSPLDSGEKSVAEISGSNATLNVDNDEEKKTSKQQQNFIEVQFSDSSTNFICKIYFAAQFAALRESVLSCGEDGFIRSLSKSVPWAARGGKSGSNFFKTRGNYQNKTVLFVTGGSKNFTNMIFKSCFLF